MIRRVILFVLISIVLIFGVVWIINHDPSIRCNNLGYRSFTRDLNGKLWCYDKRPTPEELNAVPLN